MFRCRNSLIAYAILIFQISTAGAVDRKELPEFPAVERTAHRFFSEEKLGPKDLISRSQVKALLDQIAADGWEVAERETILGQVLEDGHTLVKTLRSKQGQRFMRKVAGYKLIYDRLDRISEVAGGKRLLRNIVKLPDGHRYAAQETSGFVPDLLSFLPKTGNGRKRTIRDYEQPTGKIYTPTELLRELRAAYESEREAPR